MTLNAYSITMLYANLLMYIVIGYATYRLSYGFLFLMPLPFLYSWMLIPSIIKGDI